MILVDQAKCSIAPDGNTVTVGFTGVVSLGAGLEWRVIVNDRYVMKDYPGVLGGAVDGTSLYIFNLDDNAKITPGDAVRLSAYQPNLITTVPGGVASDPFDFEIRNDSTFEFETAYRYTTRASMQIDWGAKLLIEWTNLNQNQTVIDYARLDAAIFWAQDEVDRRLFHSVYATPLAAMSDGDARLIGDLTNRLAVVWLYDHRPGKVVDNEGRPVNLSTSIRKGIDLIFRQIASGQTALTATRRVNRPSVVGVQQSEMMNP